ADEVAGAEDQVVLGDPDFVALAHDGNSRAQGYFGGGAILPSRRATNKHAVTMSAVEPGLRLWPSARSQASKDAKDFQLWLDTGQPSRSTCCAQRLAESASHWSRFRAIRVSGWLTINCRWQVMIAPSSEPISPRARSRAGTPSSNTSRKPL